MKTQENYAYARNSKHSNLGIDVKGSARHKRNEAIELNEISSGLIENSLITRDNLLKLNPLTLPELTLKNYKTVLSAYFCLKAFPSKPVYSRYAKQDRIIKANENYFKCYESVKSYLEIKADENIMPFDVVTGLRKHVKNLIMDIRSRKDSNYEESNMLINYHNKILYITSYRVGSNTVQFKMNELDKLVSDNGIKIDSLNEVLNGKTLNQAYGVKKGTTRKETFKRASIYAKNSKRIGPNSNRFNNDSECESYLMDVIGLKGLQWGNSVPDKERKEHLRSLSFALYDLTKITGLGPSDISMNRLSIAIGARGRGGALAHYEPSLDVINLTRKNGFGSLAHEWAHFFDKQHGDGRNYLSELFRYFDNTDNKTELQKAIISLDSKMKSFKQRFVNHDDFRKMSSKKQTYWMSQKEVFARCFECWAYKTLTNKDQLNNYLTGLESHWLWPNSEEIEEMNGLFLDLFQAVNKELKEAA